MDHGKFNFLESDDSIFAGAIFMSNRETKLECLQRKLFGLPLSKSKFLKQVKAGMILFLFEHEERKLYGIFEATSDGALNIIPDAFRSTGQSYPAQKQESEIEAAQWMPIEEYAADPLVQKHEFAKYILNVGIAKLEKRYAGFSPVCIQSAFTFTDHQSYFYLNSSDLEQKSGSG